MGKVCRQSTCLPTVSGATGIIMSTDCTLQNDESREDEVLESSRSSSSSADTCPVEEVILLSCPIRIVSGSVAKEHQPWRSHMDIKGMTITKLDTWGANLVGIFFKLSPYVIML